MHSVCYKYFKGLPHTTSMTFSLEANVLASAIISYDICSHKHGIYMKNLTFEWFTDRSFFSKRLCSTCLLPTVSNITYISLNALVNIKTLNKGLHLSHIYDTVLINEMCYSYKEII